MKSGLKTPNMYSSSSEPSTSNKRFKSEDYIQYNDVNIYDVLNHYECNYDVMDESGKLRDLHSLYEQIERISKTPKPSEDDMDIFNRIHNIIEIIKKDPNLKRQVTLMYPKFFDYAIDFCFTKLITEADEVIKSVSDTVQKYKDNHPEYETIEPSIKEEVVDFELIKDEEYEPLFKEEPVYDQVLFKQEPVEMESGYEEFNISETQELLETFDAYQKVRNSKKYINRNLSIYESSSDDSSMNIDSSISEVKEENMESMYEEPNLKEIIYDEIDEARVTLDIPVNYRNYDNPNYYRAIANGSVVETVNIDACLVKLRQMTNIRYIECEEDQTYYSQYKKIEDEAWIVEPRMLFRDIYKLTLLMENEPIYHGIVYTKDSVVCLCIDSRYVSNFKVYCECKNSGGHYHLFTTKPIHNNIKYADELYKLDLFKIDNLAHLLLLASTFLGDGYNDTDVIYDEVKSKYANLLINLDLKHNAVNNIVNFTKDFLSNLPKPSINVHIHWQSSIKITHVVRLTIQNIYNMMYHFLTKAISQKDFIKDSSELINKLFEYKGSNYDPNTVLSLDPVKKNIIHSIFTKYNPFFVNLSREQKLMLVENRCEIVHRYEMEYNLTHMHKPINFTDCRDASKVLDGCSSYLGKITIYARNKTLIPVDQIMPFLPSDFSRPTFKNYADKFLTW